MSRPIHATVSLSAIRHNLQVAQAHARPQGARCLAVLKANAYGHGLRRMAPAVAESEGFAVLEMGEALALREAGLQQPILLLEGFFSASDLAAIAHYRLTPVVHRLDQLAAIESAVLAAPLPLFLKINSGMNRLGFTAADLPQLRAALAASSAFGEITLMTHFADADGAAGVTEQLAALTALWPDWQGPVSFANSAALLRYPQAARGWVRPGIMLYGASPFAEVSAETLGLRPVMTLRSEVIGVQEIAAGQAVGYGATFVAPKKMRLGVVACGYADGYPRHAPGDNVRGTPLLVGGRRSRTLGRVSMDMLACDLTDIPDAGVGTPVTLWGEGLPADEVASAAGTIAYELFCALAPRVPVREMD